MSKPRKHHYLSQFYLKGFSFKQDRSYNCYIYNIPNDTDIVEASVVDIAAKKDLFTIKEGDNKDLSLEKDFSKIEKELSIYLKNVLNIIESDGKFLNSEEEKIIDLILFQYKRSLVTSNQVVENMNKEIVKIKEDIKQEYPGVDLSYIDRKEMSKTEMNKQLKSGHFEKVMGRFPIKEALLNRNWYFFQITDCGKSFVTSDMPLYRYNVSGNDGVENPNTQIIFPLSSTIVLVIHGEGKKRLKVVKNDMEFIKRINGMTIANASNFIIGNNEKLMQKMKKWKKGGTSKYLYPKNQFLVNIKNVGKG